MTTTTQELFQLLAAAQPEYQTLPGHVFNRLAILTAGASVKYADVSLTRSDDGLSGVVFLLTDTLAVRCRLTNSAKVETFDPHDRPTADVYAVARRALTSLIIPAGTERVNADRAWDEDWGGALPAGSELQLSYAGLPESVILRASPRNRDRLTAVLPALLNDLA